MANGQIVAQDNIQTTPPSWQHPVLPAPAVQGSILLTVNDFITPPEDSSNFKWIRMEDIIGTADVRMNYNEVENTFNFYKAKGHYNNNGKWNYNWTKFATIAGISAETQEALQNLVYVSYIYDTSIANTLTVYGVKKDGTQQMICNISFVSKTEFDNAIQELVERIEDIEEKVVEAGTAIDVTLTSTGNRVSVKFGNGIKVNTNNEIVPDIDETSIILDSNNKIKANVIDDTLLTSSTKTYSIDKIIDITKYKWEYKGEVADKTLLPANTKQGSVYNVLADSELYVNTSDTTTANYVPMLEIAEIFTAYAVELHRGASGLYAKLRYDTIDFTIDNAQNLKAQIIDDTIDGSDPNANRKTYSISKLLNLLSSAMRYKGQVATYNDLPASGNVIGDMWNVQDTGDNYAWNGTIWDNLSGEYIAGAGIIINGKTISATGISFVVGMGLETTGAGTNQTLSLKVGNGIVIDTNNATSVRGGNGIKVNSFGVNVKTGYTTKIDSVTGNLEVDYANGLQQDTNNKLVAKPNNTKAIGVSNDGIETIINTTNLKYDNDGKLNTVLQIWTGVETDLPATEDNNTLYLIHDPITP